MWKPIGTFSSGVKLHFFTLCGVVCTAAVAACASAEPVDEVGMGGQTSTGGSDAGPGASGSQSGGTVGSGGRASGVGGTSMSSGGASSSGASTSSSGGASGDGGASTGGVRAGGATSIGGASAGGSAGGGKATGGANTGGNASGGSSGTGGKASGGTATGTGGKATGGQAGAGGNGGCADGDGDGLTDCDEMSDGSDWTDPAVFNGLHVQHGNQCSTIGRCQENDTQQEVDACMRNNVDEERDQHAGWDWNDPPDDICNAEYGFAPNWTRCDSTWAARWSGCIHFETAGPHCFQITGGTDKACAALYFNGNTGNADAQTGTAVKCFSVAAGNYPIMLHYTMDNGSNSSMHVAYCDAQGGATCAPTVAMPSRMFRTSCP